MQLIIFATLLAFSLARPDKLPAHEGELISFSQPQFLEKRVPQTLRDERVQNADGTYSFHYESDDGIVRTESGSPLAHAENAVGQIGSYSYPLPDGQLFTLKFVANENGFYPESPFLPVAPAFPHEIPQFVLDQIEFARLEKEAEERLAAQQSQFVQRR